MENEELKKYLSTITKNYLDELYKKTKKKNNKQTREENICEDITNKITDNFFNLSVQDINVIKEAMENNTTIELNENLKDVFILYDSYGDKKYFIPSEVKEAIKDNVYEKYQKNMIKATIFSYIDSNGLIKVDTLLNLIKNNNIDITKKELLNVIKRMDFSVEDNIIYEYPNLKALNKDNQLIDVKEQSNYRVFTTKEIEDITSRNLSLHKILNKYLKEYPEIVLNIIITIKFSVMNEQTIKDIIKETKLKEKEQKDLATALKEISTEIPKWLYNGYKNEKDFIYNANKKSISKLPDKEQKELYLYWYANINGIIKISKIKELLKHNNLKVTTSEIKEFFTKIEDYEIDNEYIYHYNVFNDSNLKTALLEDKRKLGYKVIDSINAISDKQDSDKNKIENICKKYKLSQEATNEIYLYIIYGYLNKELLEEIINDSNTNLSTKEKNLLYEELYKKLKDTICWSLNGYTKNESNELNKYHNNKKIGRNDLCPCGSGLKYKKCCGK